MQDLEDLLDKAVAAYDSGDNNKAIQIYNHILSIKEDWSKPHYNLGLIYKYNSDWDKSYFYNKRAVELNAEDEAAQWNLGIAATMLQDWKLARKCWNFFKISYDIKDEDTQDYLGTAPVRIKYSDEEGEVVWCSRICPARAIVNNIPYPQSGHRYKDIVLNDGAPNGYRVSEGKEYAVFDELQHLAVSDYRTYSIKCTPHSDEHFKELQVLCGESDIAVENWTTSVRTLCKQCSEGTPHDSHDNELKYEGEYLIAFASISQEMLQQVLDAWSNKTGQDYWDPSVY